MKKTKIAVIGLKGLPAYGGAAAVGESLINRLKEEYDFTVLSSASHTNGEIELDKVKQIVFKNIGKGGVNTMYYYLRCLVHVLINSYDLIHLHHAESGFITPLLSIRYKVIVTFHGVFRDIDPKFSNFQNKFFRFSEKLNMKYAHKVISVSNPDKEYLERKYKRNIEYIPNGINIEQIKTKFSIERIFFAAGRIYQIKGLHLLLESLHSFENNIPVLIAGDLNQVPEYTQKIKKLSDGLQIEYLGLIKSKNKLLNLISESRFFVFPSLTEAMSMMLLEVVSVRTPVIASDIPSNKAVFSNEEVLFFKSGDSNDLSDKIQYALKNPDLMKEKSKLAFLKLQREYNWDVISNEYKKSFIESINN